jgi:hypothetical protein
MPDEKKTPSETVGEMHKRREIMSDGRRYLLYYTFGRGSESPQAETKVGEREVKSENV